MPGYRTCVFLLVFMCAFWYAAADGSVQIISSDDRIAWTVSIDHEELVFEQGMVVYLPDGLHRLTAFAPGFRMIDEPLRITDGAREQILLHAAAPEIVASGAMIELTADPRTGTLILVGTAGGEAFTLDEQIGRAPSSLQVGAGTHQVTSGVYAWEVTVPAGKVVFVRFDAEAGTVQEFTVDQQQYRELYEYSPSYDRMFSFGYRRYALRRFWDLRNTSIVLGVFALFMLGIIVRFSLRGRIAIARMRKRQLFRRFERLSKADPKGRRPVTERALVAQVKYLKKLRVLLQKQIAEHRRRYEVLKGRSDAKGMRKRKRQARRVRRLVRIEKKLFYELS